MDDQKLPCGIYRCVKEVTLVGVWCQDPSKIEQSVAVGQLIRVGGPEKPFCDNDSRLVWFSLEAITPIPTEWGLSAYDTTWYYWATKQQLAECFCLVREA